MSAEKELTIRGLILGAVIAAVFTAANIYLGLRVGITIASSIPAAVISMGVLRALKTGNIRENNIVQTVASAGGTLSAIIFVLPGLIMVGWWRNFPFITTFLVCTLGGILGVLFSIPLRRALVVNSTLPFPEGLAAAAVLKAGATGDEASPDALERKRGPLIVLFGALASAATQIVSATGVAATGLGHFFRVAAGATGVNLGFSLALLGAGHLVGLSVGLAMLTGLIIAWGIATPLLSQGVPGDVAEVAITVWRTKVRFIGAGAIGVAAIWSLIKLVKPVFAGLAETARARKAPSVGGVDDRDIPLGTIGLLTAGCLLLIGWLLYRFTVGTPLGAHPWALVLGGVVFTVVIGGFVATVAGYMAGLIGASNSPVSGIGILATVAVALLLAVFAQPGLGADATAALVAFALFTVSIVFSIATISNDNLQDLKTGQLVGASPWKQQVALIVGVVAGSLVIPLTLDLLNKAYGFPGDPNRAAISAEPLPAPQAALISTLARGVLNAQLDWNTIGIGALVGLACILMDETLGALKLLRLSPLAIGIGIYLPMDATQPVVVGAVIGWLYDRAMNRRPNAEMAKRFGVLLASGLIVGESLLGVLNAGLIVATGSAAPLALVGAGFAGPATWVGVLLFALVIAICYRWVSGLSQSGAKD
ncbi:MAG TPA: oligopeptide transporter, OPT family [Candidatus Limnocylindrales bacterium]|nr:oligopeptide transporter, OPT family [Candidatus Limnocylindrales bacterium]